MTDDLGKTTVAVYKIRSTDDKRIKMRQYNLPLHFEDIIIEEWKKLLYMRIIKHSESPFSFPIVAVN